MSFEQSLPILTEAEKQVLTPLMLEPIEYRKSGLSLNHILGCPLDCAYCIRHIYSNFEMKTPKALMGDDEAVQLLLSHRFFKPHITPIQLFNRATDPMLPIVKPHTFRVLSLLDSNNLTNHVLVISRWKVSEDDCSFFNSLRNIKVTVLITYSGIDLREIEPIDSQIAADSLCLLFKCANRYRTIFYWRPIVPGLNDSDAHLERARLLAKHAHATVFTGLFYREEIAAYYREMGLEEPYAEAARRKIFPETLETRILDSFRNEPIAIFRKTSCAVSYAHAVADYNGHYGIRELCDICPTAQLERCSKEWRPPDATVVNEMAAVLDATSIPQITDKAVIVDGLDESRRYFMQHCLGYQIHDVAKPHFHGRHGRAETGWSDD